MEAKHLVFLAMSAVAIPSLAWAGVRFRWAERGLVLALLLSTSYLVDINFLSMEWYRGDTRGFEFGVTDWMVIALLVTMARSPRWRRRPPMLPPNAIPLAAYLLLAIASIATAYVPVYAGFGVFKLLRALAVYWIAFNWLRDEDDLRFILWAMVGMVAIQFALVLGQRASGVYRAVGSTPHPNTLAVYVNLLNMVFLSVLLSGRLSRRRSLPLWAGLAMGTLVVLATFSRGALAVMVLGYALVIATSLFDRTNPRKLAMVGLMALAAMPFALKLAPSIIQRFETAPVESGLSRHQANSAALAMAHDHLLGVGLNNYSHVVNNTGYARFIPLESDRGIVHNIYLLQASELGWAGLAALLAVIAGFFWQGTRFLLRRRADLATAVAGGIVIGMVVLWSQSLLEWLFRQTYVTIEFFLLAGFLAAMPRVSREARRCRRRKVATALLLAAQLDRRSPALPLPAAG